MCLQQKRDISGDQSLSGNMVSSDCWGMSTVLILCKPVWGMICSAAQHPFLMENSPSSQSIYGSWKRAHRARLSTSEVTRSKWSSTNKWRTKILYKQLKLFIYLYIRGMLGWNILSIFLLFPPCRPYCGLFFGFKSKMMFYIIPDFCSSDFQRWHIGLCFLA